MYNLISVATCFFRNVAFNSCDDNHASSMRNALCHISQSTPRWGTPRRRLTQATPRALAAVAFVKMATHHGRSNPCLHGESSQLGEACRQGTPEPLGAASCSNALSFNPHAQSCSCFKHGLQNTTNSIFIC